MSRLFPPRLPRTLSDQVRVTEPSTAQRRPQSPAAFLCVLLISATAAPPEQVSGMFVTSSPAHRHGLSTRFIDMGMGSQPSDNARGRLYRRKNGAFVT
jgi:hypothetical protein